jgi:16S rRNA (guanine966-N2)-methyltransferase
VRVIAGRFGGRRLQAPPGTRTRPTGDRVREALFSVLGPLEGLDVLDLFAGSGALGIEALSRGAARATFVEQAAPAVRTIRANLDALELDAEVHRRDARAFLRHASSARHEYDLIFLDPPYRLAAELGRDLSPALAAVLAPGGRLVGESDHRAPLDLDVPLLDERRYGDTLIRIHATQ